MQKLRLDEYARRLCDAMDAYDYQRVTYNFTIGREKRHDSMLEVEDEVRGQLFSCSLTTVKDGLSNVLYWGHATVGYQWDRVEDFRSRVSRQQLTSFREILEEPSSVGIKQIGDLRLPQFGNAYYALLPFNSKILMFIDPDRFPVLDNRLADFGDNHRVGLLEGLKTKSDVSIRLTKKNAFRYEHWAAWCKRTAVSVNYLASSPRDGIRAVDVERAIYSSIPSKGDNDRDADLAKLLLAGPDTE